jgi:hypothetical protein
MVAAAIDKILIPEAVVLVAEYYDEAGPFAGATFETLGVNEPDTVGIDDLLALTLLDVAVSARGLRRVLGADAPAISAALTHIPCDVPLWEADDEVLDRCGQLWTALKTVGSIKAVKAGKLLARKRPLLIPVVDKWVVAALPAPSGQYWRSIREALRDEDRRARIETLRGNAPSGVSTLRLLDVAIWMQFSESGNARGARARAGLPVAPRSSRSR